MFPIHSVALLPQKSLIHIRYEIKAAPLLQNVDIWFINTQAPRAQQDTGYSPGLPYQAPILSPTKVQPCPHQVSISFLNSGFCLSSSEQTHPTFFKKNQLAKLVKNP